MRFFTNLTSATKNRCLAAVLRSDFPARDVETLNLPAFIFFVLKADTGITTVKDRLFCAMAFLDEERFDLRKVSGLVVISSIITS